MTVIEDEDIQDELRMLLEVWEQENESSTWDPDSALSRIAEILDAATNDFILNNPDPLDDRHPIKALPHCNLGHLLKIILKLEGFVNKLVTSYLLAKDNTKRNVLACRVLIGILPGLDTNVILSDADSLVLQLFRWAEHSESRELRAYSMSLLGAAMDAEQAHQYRANNTALIPVALQRLRELYTQMMSDYKKHDDEQLKNNPMHGATNFSRLISEDTAEKSACFASPLPMNNGVTLSDEPSLRVVPNGSDAKVDAKAELDELLLRKRRRLDAPTARESKRSKMGNGLSVDVEDVDVTTNEVNIPERVPAYQPIRVTSKATPSMLLSPASSSLADQHGGFSNSSWKNVMHPIVIGVHRLYPLSVEMEQRLILHYLIPTCEYQDNLSIVLESRALDVILNYLSMDGSRDIRLLFDALKYTSSLLVHRKFAWEFIAAQGVEKLFRVNRFSMASTAVATCLYYLAYSTDIMEKVCHLSDSVLSEMVDYALWLLDHSHESGRASAAMFFSYAMQFKTILDRFDQHDGLRRLYNYISTLTVLQDDSAEADINDDHYAQSALTIKNAIYAFKAYLTTHLFLKIEHIKRSQIGRYAIDGLSIPSIIPSGSHPHSKAISMDPESERDCINYLIQSQCLLMIHHHNWKPIDEMRNLGVFRLLLDLLSNAEWNNSTKPETIRLVLDFFRLASVSPKIQLDLCETAVVRSVSVQGIGLILDLAEGDVFSDPALQKVALEVVINCVCGPTEKNVGGLHHKITNLDPEFLPPELTATSSNALPSNTRNKNTNDLLALAASSSSSRRNNEKAFLDAKAILRIAWECAKKNNAIMTLTTLLHTKDPPTDADMLREVACRALNGIARHEPVRQILSKLPLITSNELNALMQEPVLLEKRQEHSKFCEQARALIGLVTEAESVQDFPKDMTQEKLWKATVVKNTKIVYNEKELLQLMYQHLNDIGFKKTARQLQQEANLPSIPASRIPSTPSSLPVFPSRNAALFTSTKPKICATPKTKTSFPSLSTPTPKRAMVASASKSQTQNSSFTGGQFSLQVKPYKTLNEIVTEYFRKQHATCRNPITTCPPFSLFYPHKCPEPRLSYAAPSNLVQRHFNASNAPFRCTQEMLRQANRRLIFSRFRHWKSFTEDGETFTSCCFSNNNEYIILGNYTGELLWFNLKNGQLESTTSCHQSAITSIQQSKHDASLLLTSSAFVRPYSTLWRVGAMQDQLLEFPDESFVDFGNRSAHQLIATQTIKATIFDTETGSPVVQLYDETVANHYSRNRACFDPNDELVLNDGVLFDPRIGQSGRVIHKFDKLNPDISGIFHPKGSEVIINSEVWDLRTHRLLHTVPALNQCKVTFNSTGNIIFGVAHQPLDLMDDRFFQMFNSSFRTFDAGDYQVISTVETKRPLLDFCTDDTDYYVAIIETNREIERDDSNFCKIFEIGRRREADEEDEEQDQNDDEQDEDDEYSSSNTSSEDHFSSNSDDEDDEDDVLFLHDGEDADDEDEEENDENFEHSGDSSGSSSPAEGEDEEEETVNWSEDDDENDADYMGA